MTQKFILQKVINRSSLFVEQYKHDMQPKTKTFILPFNLLFKNVDYKKKKSLMISMLISTYIQQWIINLTGQ